MVIKLRYEGLSGAELKGLVFLWFISVICVMRLVRRDVLGS